jgi:predicted NAD/FAD-binding protein
MEEMRVAVVGAGVSGLAAAHELARTGGGRARVTVYEAEESLGGHARTADVDGVHLDLGFMVFNRVRIYIRRRLSVSCSSHHQSSSFFEPQTHDVYTY